MNVRYTFLDVYRGIIVLCMVEGHLTRELLRPELHETWIFRLHELFHGIVGPGFLLGAGITFGISVQRHWADFLVLSPRFIRRLGRILLLFVLGYVLHLPFFSFSKILSDATASNWAKFFSFDILQCIGLSLLLLHLLMIAVRRERFFVVSSIALLIAVVYAAPIVWGVNTERLPLALASVLHGKGGSPYPLFPYGGFLVAGALVSYEFMRFAEAGKEVMFVRRLALAGVAISVIALAADALPISTYEPYNFWLMSPNFFLMKLGSLFLLMAGIWMLEHAAFEERLSVKHRWLVLVGVESLFVYVVHLIVLYGWILNPEASLSFHWSGNLDWSRSLLLSLGLIFVLYGLARLWNFLKEDHPVFFKGVVWWLAGTFLLLLFTRPY